MKITISIPERLFEQLKEKRYVVGVPISTQIQKALEVYFVDKKGRR